MKGQSSEFNATQVNRNIDYNISQKDRLAGKYYYQSDPTIIPFGVSAVPGFAQTMHTGSQMFSLDNTTILSPNATWENRYGFIREIANASTAQSITSADVGLNVPLPATASMPESSRISMKARPFTTGFIERHTFAFGEIFDYTQLNVVNRENQVASFTFNDFADFLTGTLGSDHSDAQFSRGETNRHFRSKSAGLFAQDDWKVRPNLTMVKGVRPLAAMPTTTSFSWVFVAISLRPVRWSSSLISDSVAIALVPPAMMNWTRVSLRWAGTRRRRGRRCGRWFRRLRR